MEFSCHTWAFNDLTLPEALGTIARLGFRYADLGSGPHINNTRVASRPRPIAAEIRQDLDAFNLKLGDLCLMLPRISIADEAKRQADVDTFKALIPFAKSIRAPGITLSPGLLHPTEDVDAYDRTVVALREMVKAAKEADLPVSIEPHMDSMAQSPGMALRMVKDVPGLKLTVDWAQMVCQNIRHDQIVELLPHARHVQIRQAARAQLQLPFDRGRIDAAQVVGALREANYDGLVGVEYMQTVGWHGSVAVNNILECARMRDELSAVRDADDTEEAGQ